MEDEEKTRKRKWDYENKAVTASEKMTSTTIKPPFANSRLQYLVYAVQWREAKLSFWIPLPLVIIYN